MREPLLASSTDLQDVSTGASCRVDDGQGRGDGELDGRSACRSPRLTEYHVVDRCIDRRHDHPSDQVSASRIVDLRREELGGEVDQLRPRSVEFDVDLMCAGCVVHHEEMQFVELVLLDEEVDDTAEDDVETRLGAQSA